MGRWASISELAREYHLSPRHLRRQVTEWARESPGLICRNDAKGSKIRVNRRMFERRVTEAREKKPRPDVYELRRRVEQLEEAVAGLRYLVTILQKPSEEQGKSSNKSAR